MKDTLGALKQSHNSLRILQDVLGHASILAVPIHSLGGDTLKTRENDCKLTPEIPKIL